MALEKFRIFIDESPGNVVGATAAGGGGGGGVGANEQDDGANHLNNKLALIATANAAAAAANAAANAKREPLGLRQPLGQAAKVVEQSQQLLQLQPQSQQPGSSLIQQQQQANFNTSTISNSSSTSISVNDEDQENDISMASLGSDFVPSVLHHDEHSFVDDDSFDDDETELNITAENLNNHDNKNRFNINISDDEDEIICDEEELLIDESLGDENDEELAMELSQAFKQHDGPQIFNSKVYIDDILSYLHQMERSPKFRPLANYMTFQSDIDAEKRTILINWLVEVSDEFELQTETLFICVALIDRFLSKMSIPTSNLQLLGVAAMFTASKYEEIYPPNLYQFVEITDETYTGAQIRIMEQEILTTLDFQISPPTVTYFLRQIFSYNKFPKRVYHLAEYLCYLSLVSDQPFLEYLPSEIALASVMLASHQLGSAANVSADLKEAFNESNLNQLNRRELPKGVKLRDVDRRIYIINKELPFCIESLRAFQERAQTKNRTSQPESAIFHRYSLAERDSVSLLPALKVEDLKRIVK